MDKESIVDEDSVRYRFVETQKVNECSIQEERRCYLAFRLGVGSEYMNKIRECYRTIYEELKNKKS